MSTKADKTGKKITDHVPPRPMIYIQRKKKGGTTRNVFLFYFIMNQERES